MKKKIAAPKSFGSEFFVSREPFAFYLVKGGGGGQFVAVLKKAK